MKKIRKKYGQSYTKKRKSKRNEVSMCERNRHIVNGGGRERQNICEVQDSQ